MTNKKRMTNKNSLCGGVVAARPRWNEADVDLFILEFGRVVYKACLGGLQELLVVAFGEVRLIVGSARLIAQPRALHNNAPELQHVVEMAGKGKAGVRPLGLVRQDDVLEALQ